MTNPRKVHAIYQNTRKSDECDFRMLAFFGFDFAWSRSQKCRSYRFVRPETNKEKFRGSLGAFKEWIKRSRHVKFRDLLVVLRRRLQGYWNYYGVRGNSHMLAKYDLETKRLRYKWLNRRSQRRRMTWTQFSRRWLDWGLPPLRVNMNA